MPTLSARQIAGIVKYLGGSTGSSFASSMVNPDTDGPIAVAICLAESGGVTDKVGGPNSNGSKDYGLWQINDKAHADLLKSYKWADPNDNFRMAMIIYGNSHNKWTAWSSYNSGVYATHMAAATVAWGNPDTSKADTNAVENTINTGASVVTSTADLVSALTKSSTWIRVGMAVGGLILLLIAFEPILKGHLGAFGPVGKAAELAQGMGEKAGVSGADMAEMEL